MAATFVYSVCAIVFKFQEPNNCEQQQRWTNKHQKGLQSNFLI